MKKYLNGLDVTMFIFPNKRLAIVELAKGDSNVVYLFKLNEKEELIKISTCDEVSETNWSISGEPGKFIRLKRVAGEEECIISKKDFLTIGHERTFDFIDNGVRVSDEHNIAYRYFKDNNSTIVWNGFSEEIHKNPNIKINPRKSESKNYGKIKSKTAVNQIIKY